MAGSILDREIHTYACTSDPSRKCIALINGCNMIFKGNTPMQAHMAADNWRREALANFNGMTKAQKAELLGEAVE